MSLSAPEGPATLPHPDDVRAYVEYLRDLGIYDLLSQSATTQAANGDVGVWASQYMRPAVVAPAAGARAARPTPAEDAQRKSPDAARAARPQPDVPALSPFDKAQQRHGMRPTQGSDPSPLSRQNAGPEIRITPPAIGDQAGPLTAARAPLPSRTPVAATEASHASGAQDMPAPTSFNLLKPLPEKRTQPSEKASALQALRAHIGDCTRCPLAYAGRHSIVFADGDPNAQLMFVGEGPGADEDEQGLPFVGKAGQLLNNMIGAMGLRREQVYIANIVKCRPPKNRVPEPVEANTCSPFLLDQIDIVQPRVIVALGGTAATYLLGVRQSLTSLRGQWFDVRGAKCAVTYHPAFLLRDPRQKGEAWKDLQRVMTELKLKPPSRA